MRLGIVHDVLIFMMIGALAVAAYLGLRRFGAGLALFGLVAMAIEVALSLAIELSSFAAIHVVRTREPGLELILYLRASGYMVVILMFAASTAAFSVLLQRSGHVPQALAAFGLLASGLLLAATVFAVMTPTDSALGDLVRASTTTASGLAMLFQTGVGAWLLVRGATTTT
jgi:hypothetical protein